MMYYDTSVVYHFDALQSTGCSRALRKAGGFVLTLEDLAAIFDWKARTLAGSLPSGKSVKPE